MNKFPLLLLLLLSPLVSAENFDPTKIYIIEGACPFECCTYREWGVVNDAQLYLYKSVESEKIVIANSGSTVQALTGDVHVIPLKLFMTSDYGIHHAGDTIWLLNYLGEGNYRAWKNGDYISFELPFSPYGGKRLLTWGEIDGEYNMTWWVKIRTQDGLVGWTHQVENFSNQDSCA